MTLETWTKVREIKDLGALTVECPKCKQQTKIRDMDGFTKPMVCSKCAEALTAAREAGLMKE